MTKAKQTPKPIYTPEMAEGMIGRLQKGYPAIEDKKRHISAQEFVKLLSKEVRAMESRGYSIEQIGEALRKEGLPIQTSTLRNYLKGKSRKKAAPKSEATGEALTAPKSAPTGESPAAQPKSDAAPAPAKSASTPPASEITPAPAKATTPPVSSSKPGTPRPATDKG